MDTNLFQLIQMMSEKKTFDYSQLMLIATLATPLLLGIKSYIDAKTAAEVQRTAAENTKILEKVHMDGNSRLTTQIAKVEQLTTDVLRLTAENSKLLEQRRGDEKVAALVPKP